MARPIMGEEPLRTVVRFRVTDTERTMLRELCPDGEISAYLRAYIRRQHRLMLRKRADSVSQDPISADNVVRNSHDPSA